MTGDVRAACEEALEAGATEALVVHGHSSMRNILLDDLPERVVLHRSPASVRTLCQVEGLDASAACVLLVGYHSMAGSDGLLSHTWHGGGVGQLRLNGTPIGETAITAAIAGHHGVPVVLACGDQVLAEEAARAVRGITTVTGKESTGVRTRGANRSRRLPRRSATRPPTRSRRASVQPVVTVIPVQIEIDAVSHRQAERIVRFLPLERLGVQTVRITAATVPHAFAGGLARSRAGRHGTRTVEPVIGSRSCSQ